MSGPSRRIRLTLPVQVTTDGLLVVTRRQDNRLYLRGEAFWNPNAYAYGDLLSVLRTFGFGIAADVADGHGQAVSTLQLVGMAESGGDDARMYSTAEARGRALALSESPLPVKMELPKSFASSSTPKTFDAVTANGQLVTALYAFAMPTQGLVFGAGYVLAEFEGHLFTEGPAEAREALGHIRGYLLGSLNPGSDAGLVILPIGIAEAVGTLFGESQKPDPVLMASGAEFETSGVAEVLSTYTVTFVADGKIVHQENVLEGDACPDPVATGVIDTPATGSSDGFVYVYSGWSLTEGGSVDSEALTTITEDLTVYAAFSKMYAIEGDFTMKSGPWHTVTYGNSNDRHAIYPGGMLADSLYVHTKHPTIADLEIAFVLGDAVKSAKSITVTSTLVYTATTKSTYKGNDRLISYYYDSDGNIIGKYNRLSSSSYDYFPAGTNVTRTRTATFTPPANAKYMILDHVAECGTNIHAPDLTLNLTINN